MLTAPRTFFGSCTPSRTEPLPPARLPFVVPVRRQAGEGAAFSIESLPIGIHDSHGAVRARHSTAVVPIAPVGTGPLLSGGCAGHRIASGIAQ